MVNARGGGGVDDGAGASHSVGKPLADSLQEMFMKLMAVACLSLVLGACASTHDRGGDEARVIDVAFSCDNGERLSVQFHQDRELAVLTRNGQSIELPQQPSGSGFIYSNGPNTLRGKGDELTVEIGRMVPIQCRAES